MERHHLNTFVDDITAKVAGTSSTVTGSNHHTTTAMEHVTTDIVYVGTFHRTRAAHHDIIGRVDTITAGAMGSQQVVPAIFIHQGAGLTIDGNILLYVALDAFASLGVELDEADIAEIGAIGSPQTTGSRIEQQTGVNGIAVLHTIGRSHLNSCRPLEVGRLRVEGLVPHGKDATVMATEEATTRSTIDA